jgi:ABC-type bacteriocin/lantibiotic exporter with double-glycine peptidase domain
MLSTRSASRQIQALYKNFLVRLSAGYNGMRWERFVERNRSELLNHAVHTAREAADFYHRCVEMIASTVIVVIMITVLVYQSPIAAAGLCAAVISFYTVHRFVIRKRLQEAASSREQSLRALQRYLTDMLLSGKEIRTYKNHAFFFNRLSTQADSLALSNQRVLLLPQIARILADQGVVLLFLGIVIGVGLQHGDTRQLLALLVFYFALSRRLLPLISQISLIAGQMESSYENVRIVDSELNDCLLHREPTLPVQLPDPEFVLELDHVSFSFHDALPIMQNVSLRLRWAETMVLRGASGSGKSSLLNLIAGVSQPASGVVRVDRTRIAYVPQEIPLLDDTIRNNLLFGLSEKSDVELLKALAVAMLEEFVATQPLGPETSVGDNGILFSGGERQRLGLARAVLRGATLLLLDEATSALDEDNERQVLDNLKASGIATLLVTHRAHARPFAQREFQLQEGRLVEDCPRQVPLGEQVLSSGAAR